MSCKTFIDFYQNQLSLGKKPKWKHIGRKETMF